MKRTGQNLRNPLWGAAQKDWSVEDSAAAEQQGWNIYAGPSSVKQRDGDPPFQVWRDDTQRILMDDAAAHKLLRELVKSDDPLGIKARNFLRRHSPREYARVFLNFHPS